MHATPAERKAIQVYVEDQLLEEVVCLEKVAAELIGRARYDIWDILSTDGRWWVITNPVNLYSQADFKRHVALDFHIGLKPRTSCRPGLEVMCQEPEPGALLPGSWRRWEKAVGTWEYVNWLMHAKNAKRIDAEVGLREVYRLLGIFGGVVSDQG